MKKLVPIFLALFSCGLFAGEGGYFAPGVIDRVTTKEERTPPNNINSKEVCFKKGGEWFEDKHYNYRFCVIPYPDAGKLCKNSKDCLGHCIWPLNGKALDDKILEKGYGICQLNDHTDDCGRPHFENGEIIYFKCD